MCYTGKCKYEDHMGNCQLDRNLCFPNYPDDAYCIQTEKEIDEVTLLERVNQLKYKHRYTWRDKPQWYWMLGLLEEVAELGLALIGLHEGPVEWELLQIASICLNWVEYREEI